MKMSYGFWPLAILMIVVASWVVYHYLAPKRWREWTRVGLIQAFIIALYAEMYGFPLTIDLLTRFLKLDRKSPYLSGNLWSYLLGYGETGMMIAMVAGYALVFAGLSMLAAGWREVYRARREGRLATRGLYRFVRHPQYTGIFLALFGEGVVHWPTVFSVALFPVIVWAYVRLARKEEEQMIACHGEEYLEYRCRVPMFLPRWGQWRRLLEASRSSAGGQS